MMKISTWRYAVTLSILLLSISAQAQEVYKSSGNKRVPKQEKKGFDVGRMVYGGNVQFSIGNGILLGIQPKVGYRLLDNLAAGIGTGFTYFKLNDYFEEYDPNISAYRYYDYKATIFTPSAWIWYTPFPFLFVNAEYEHNFIWDTDYRYTLSGTWESYTRQTQQPRLWMGAGFRQALGPNASFNIGLYYDLLNKSGDPYNGIGYRAGIMLGI